MFTRGEYFENLGFKVDPFASTNSENEEFLVDYFIEPPYFASLIGDYKRPKSSIVIAPRGFGKTAQRKRIEKLTENPKQQDKLGPEMQMGSSEQKEAMLANHVPNQKIINSRHSLRFRLVYIKTALNYFNAVFSVLKEQRGF